MRDIVTELKKRGLDSKGNRAELVTRLCKAVTGPGPEVKQSPVKQKQQVKEAGKKGTSPVISTKEISDFMKKVEEFKRSVEETSRQDEKQKKLQDNYNYIQSTDEQFTAVTTYDPTRRIIHLSGPILRAMSGFVKAGTEYGGMIDINSDGSFDRSIFGIGEKGAINIGDMLDFEVIFHTHPAGRTAFMFEQPSKSDINLSMIAGHNTKLKGTTSKHQVNVVFTPEGIYTIYALNSSSDVLRKQATEAYGTPPTKADIKNVIKRLESVGKYGVYIFRYSKITKLKDVDDEPINNWPESIPLYIDPQEPVISLTRRRARDETPKQRQERQKLQAADREDDKRRSRQAKELRKTIDEINMILTNIGYTEEQRKQYWAQQEDWVPDPFD